MAIDDLSSQRALERIQYENLSKAPELATSLPGIAIKFIAGVFNRDPTQMADLFAQYQDALESDRSSYLFRCVVEDLKWLQGKVEKLTQKQQEYLCTDWMALLVDSDRKARATVGKTKIERIAKILSSSIRIEPTLPAESVEELTHIAMELTDNDVLVLKHVREALDRYHRLPADAVHNLMIPNVPGLTSDSVLGICAKLQSLGLIATPEQHAIAISHGSYPTGGGFVPLERADAFLKFIGEANYAVSD